MKIKLLSKRKYTQLKSIQTKYPILTFQNVGYQYIDKSKFTEKDKVAFDKVTEILKLHIERFVEFNNFLFNRVGELVIRFQYHYDSSFTGVGYITLEELHKGFKDEN